MKKISTFEKTNEIALGGSRIALGGSKYASRTALAASRRINVIAQVGCRKIYAGCARDLRPATTWMEHDKTRKQIYTILYSKVPK